MVKYFVLIALYVCQTHGKPFFSLGIAGGLVNSKESNNIVDDSYSISNPSSYSVPSSNYAPVETYTTSTTAPFSTGLSEVGHRLRTSFDNSILDMGDFVKTSISKGMNSLKNLISSATASLTATEEEGDPSYFPASSQSSGYDAPESSYILPSTYTVTSGSYISPSGSYNPPTGSYSLPTGSYGPPTGSYSPPTGSYSLPSGLHNPSFISHTDLTHSFLPSQVSGSGVVSPFQQTFQNELHLKGPSAIGSIEGVRSPASFVPVGQFASRPSGLIPGFSTIQSDLGLASGTTDFEDFAISLPGPNEIEILSHVRTPDPTSLLTDDIHTIPNSAPVPFTFAPHEAVNNPTFQRESNPAHLQAAPGPSFATTTTTTTTFTNLRPGLSSSTPLAIVPSRSDIERRPIVFFDITVDGIPAGTIFIELFNETVPKTAENFRVLATGESGPSYAGTRFHRLLPGLILQGGDIKNGDGTGQLSIYGDHFEDENFLIPHDSPGLLSMANEGPDSNGSQFFITLARLKKLDGKNVVFGRIYDETSFNLVENLNIEYGREDGMPRGEVLIANSGEFDKVNQIKRVSK